MTWSRVTINPATLLIVRVPPLWVPCGSGRGLKESGPFYCRSVLLNTRYNDCLLGVLAGIKNSNYNHLGCDCLSFRSDMFCWCSCAIPWLWSFGTCFIPATHPCTSGMSSLLHQALLWASCASTGSKWPLCWPSSWSATSCSISLLLTLRGMCIHHVFAERLFLLSQITYTLKFFLSFLKWTLWSGWQLRELCSLSCGWNRRKCVLGIAGSR